MRFTQATIVWAAAALSRGVFADDAESSSSSAAESSTSVASELPTFTVSANPAPSPLFLAVFRETGRPAHCRVDGLGRV